MSRRWITFAVFALDILWLVTALGLSYGLRYSELHPHSSSYWLLIVAGVGAWGLLFRTMRLDGFDGGCRMTTLISRISVATALLMTFALAIAYLDRIYYSRLLLGYFSVLLFFGFPSIRFGIYLFLRSQHQRGLTRKVVLLGNDRVTHELAFNISRHPELLYEVVGTLYLAGDDSADRHGDLTSGGSLLSSIDVLETLNAYRIDELIVLDQPPGVEFQNFVARCRNQGVHVSVLPRGYELYTAKLKLMEIEGLPLLSLEGPAGFPLSAMIKRAMDITGTLLLAIPASLITGAAMLVLVLHKGRAMRGEVRIGKGGRPFLMYRLNIDRESDRGPRYERILRDLSISELPQLWNVLGGDMSLVGPRPEPPERVKHYSDWQRQRLKAIPGMTGLAQVNGLREQHPSEDKTRFDLQYILEWSPLLDCSLLLWTVDTLARRCFRSSRRADIISMPGSDHNAVLNVRASDSVRSVMHADRA